MAGNRIGQPAAEGANVKDRVTRVIERCLAENSKIENLESTTRAGVAVVTITLDKNVNDTAKEFDDIWLKLSNLGGLPDGATLQFKKDFGDTSALMLTVASPRAGPVELQLRAAKVAAAIRDARAAAASDSDMPHATRVVSFPHALDPRELEVMGRELAARAEARGERHVKLLSGPGFLGLDSRTDASDEDSSATRSATCPSACAPPTSTATSGRWS